MKTESGSDLEFHRDFSCAAGRRVLGVWLTALFGLLLPGFVYAQLFTEFPAPGRPGGIAAGPDGALWFTESSDNKIGRLTIAGVVTEFPIPTGGSNPAFIAAGPDGNLWFTETGGNKIGRITPSGLVDEFPIPTAGSVSLGIAAGPDGNLWFTEASTNKIGRITPSGLIAEFPIPTAGSAPNRIVAGPDGNLWFTEWSIVGNKIGRINSSGLVVEFPIPTAGSHPLGIAAGPDGNLWFTESDGNKIGRITPSGLIAEFPIPTAGSHPLEIAAGPDGNLWFTEYDGNKIGSITPSGLVAEFPIPTAGSHPNGIAAGPDGNLWFTEADGNKIGRIRVAVSRVIPVVISSPGQFGSFFKTAVQMSNPSAESISGRFIFHPGGGSGNASDPSLAFTIAPRQTVSYPDVLPAMGLSGVGTMDLMLPVVGSQIPNPIAVVRLYNDGGAAGTSGFTEDLIDPYGERVLLAGATGYLIGPADTSRFRYNVGVRTLSSGASLIASLLASDGSEIRTVVHIYPSTHFEQTDAASFLGGALGPDQSIEISVVSGSAIIYGATADNTTNDSSIQFARKSD